MTTNLPVATEIIPVVLQLQPAIAMTNDQFYEFCQLADILHRKSENHESVEIEL